MIKRILGLTVLVTLILQGTLIGWAEAVPNPNFKVVGYCSEMFADPVDHIQYDKLTHIIYAFLIPGSDGTLIGIEKPEKLRALVSAAHAKGVKVSVAVGGWSYKNVPLQGNFEKLAGDVKSRKLFVRNTVAFLKEYNLDGLDLDWEYPTAPEPYEALVRELNTALDAEGLTLSAALNGAWSDTGAPLVSSFVTPQCLENFDWINIMAYDADPTGPGHSPLWFAESSIRYWTLRGVPKEKILLGVPFYGAPGWVQYRDIVKANPDNAYGDQASVVVGTWGQIPVYYNGIATIQEKTRLALLKAGGIMIFDINEDTLGDTSLLTAIDSVVGQYSGQLEALQSSAHVVVHGNPLIFRKEQGEGEPYVDQQGRVMVPLRRCLEAIQAQVAYEQGSQTITATREGITVIAKIGNRELQVNGTSISMDTEAKIREGRTYVPVRFIYESFGKKIEWHNSTRTVIVE